MGGAIFNFQGEVSVINSTIAGNSAAGGAPQSLPNPAQGLGGAVFNLNGEFTAIGSTFRNSATSHATSIYNLVSDKVERRDSQATLRNTIVAHTVGGASEDVVSERSAGALAGSGADASIGERDIVENATGLSGGTLTGAALTDNPLLGDLADNGGPTQTNAARGGKPGARRRLGLRPPHRSARALPALRPTRGEQLRRRHRHRSGGARRPALSRPTTPAGVLRC